MRPIFCKVTRTETFRTTSQRGCFGRRHYEARREFLECGHNVIVLATAPEAKQRKCPKCSLIGTKQFYGGV